MATLVKYKDQVTVNLDNVVFIKVDEVEQADGKCAVRLHSVDGFEKHWECSDRFEALEVERKIVDMLGQRIEL